MKTINAREEFARQTEIRLDLLKQGYRPLPTAEKVAFQKGWPTMKIDHRTIKKWPEKVKRFSDTGVSSVPAITTAIQMTGTMLAIDVDVQNREASGAIEDLIASKLGKAWDLTPYRHSGNEKFMVLLRTDEPYRMWKTRKYVDPDGNDHMVEVYGGASTRYFSCFGPHTLGKVVKGEYEVLREYEWMEGLSPLTMTPDELPLLTVEEVDELLTAIGDTMDEMAPYLEWEELTGGGHGHLEGGVEYDLTPDMEFDTKDGLLSYDEAIGYAINEREARCSGSFLDGESSNKSRCRMSVVQDGEELHLSVFDYESWTMHYPESWAPRTVEEQQEKSAALGDMLRRALPREVEDAIEEAREQGADTDAFEDMIEHLLDNVAMDTITGGVRWLNRPSHVWHSIAYGTAKAELAHLDLTWVGPRGGNRRFSVLDAWRAHEDKLKVAGVRFNPRTTERVYRDEDGSLYGNGYFGLPQFEWGCYGDVLDRYLHHLVPDQEELDWLLDWLADKYQRPWHRNCAVLFVASGIQGAGRGFLFSILRKVFGYTQHVSEKDLLGARFNDFMENSLLLFTNEVGGLGWKARKEGYETLKDRVDPSNTDVTIERKSIPRYATKTYASFMLATNNPGGLVMDAEDRRIAVITNGSKLQGKLLEAMTEIGVERLAEHLASGLRHREVTRNVADAPAFAGRELMLQANDTELDDALRTIIEEAPAWRAWVRSDFEARVKLEMTGTTKGSVPGLRQEITNLKGKRGERMGAWLLSERVKVGSSPVAVITKNPDLFLAATPEDRAKICKGNIDELEGTNVVPIK